MSTDLPELASVLAVCAHPDDESFGLGGILEALARRGTEISLLCFTHGEASSLHGIDGDLERIRAEELAAAAGHLGITRIDLLDYPDGNLAAQSPEELIDLVMSVGSDLGVDGLLTFDHGGISGHPDHQAATDATLGAGRRIAVPVLAWAIPEDVASALNSEFRTSFVGRSASDCDIIIDVDRGAQLEAIECHASQSRDNPVLRRRLELQGPSEWIRTLNRSGVDQGRRTLA